MNICFSSPPECILHEDPTHPGGNWLPSATTNPASNCLALNAQWTFEDIAVLWRDEGDDDASVNKMTIKELRASVWYAIINFYVGSIGYLV